MTTEQRLDRLEQIAVDWIGIPTNDRQKTIHITYDHNQTPYTVLTVHRFPNGDFFTTGDKVRFDGTDYTIIHFTESFCGVYVTISNAAITKTVPLSDLMPIPMASHNWAANHGVKEWEIVEFRSVDTGEYFTMYLNKDKNGYCNLPLSAGEGASLTTMLLHVQDGNHTIQCVRRLSDNELFTVGDKIDYPNRLHSPGGCTICHFTISDGEIFVNNHHNGTPHTRIKDWIRCEERKSLFTTADGVPVNEGDIVYFYDGNGTVSSRAIDIMNPEGWCCTRAAAEAAYDKWLYEQPVLTLADIDGDHRAPEYMAGLVKLVKDKLSKK